MTETVASVKELRSKLEAWIAYREFGGVTFYTQAEWTAKGETLCADAVLSAAIEDSPLQVILNYAWPPDVEDIVQELTRLLERLGYWYEIGHSWSLHFYPL